MSVMRSSLKEHVGLLPDDVSRGPKLSKSSSCVASLDSAQPLSSYYIDALASRLSPHPRTSAVAIPRQYCSEIEGELACWSIDIYVIITWKKRFESQ